MKSKVTEQGLLIPKHLLKGFDEADTRKRNGIIVVSPASSASPISPDDPIFNLGKNPIEEDLGMEDASVNLDRVYLYGYMKPPSVLG